MRTVWKLEESPDEAMFTYTLDLSAYGNPIYVEGVLLGVGETLVGTNILGGKGSDPAHILRMELTPEGLKAHCRKWREGDMVVNPATNSCAPLRRDNSGCLHARFPEGDSYIGWNFHPGVTHEGSPVPLREGKGRYVEFSTLRCGDSFYLRDLGSADPFEKGDTVYLAESDAYVKDGYWTIEISKAS